MFKNHSVIDIQIFHDSQWSSFYKAFYDINIIYIIYSLIQCDVSYKKIRIVDKNGNIIDQLYLSNKEEICTSIITDAYYNLAFFWENKGDLQKALKDFRNYYRLNPNDPDAPIEIQRLKTKLKQKKSMKLT